jgi:hypothetical protein
MGDTRHRKTLPKGPEEIVTPAFRNKARDIMRANKLKNEAHGIGPEDSRYLIDNDVQLAIVVIGNKEGKTQIGNILGPVKPTTKPRGLVDRTEFLQPIREALNMEDPIFVKIDVQRRAPIVEWIAGLPESDFAVFESAWEQAAKKRP